MAERIPPLTPRPSKELARYEETKRLAEMAWALMHGNPHWSEYQPLEVADGAWRRAEAMCDESERRRPVK